MAAKKNTASPTADVSEILEVSRGKFDCCIVGTSPYICNRMSQKAMRELLYPKGRKNAVEKATSLKHDPKSEFRASPYTLKDPSRHTWLAVLATAFKGAICSAALDMPGAKKAQVGRLCWVEGELVELYGVPKLSMAIVRSADMNKTPDVRSRAILPEWACRITVTFVKPLIRVQQIANLLGAAGITIGVGDWRQQKGSGSYGQFRVADQDDKDFLRIMKQGGRTAQLAAMDNPVCYDDETTELLSWFEDERGKRALKGVA
jgi:hypothetical protein